MSAVFISYAAEDRKVADAICHHLERRGLRCWVAPRDVQPGKEWPAQIAEAIDQCDVFVLVFSRSCNESGQTLREVTMAVNAGKIVVPLRIHDVAPSGSLRYLLSVPHWLDAMTPPLEDHFERLADNVQAVVGATESAAPRVRRPRRARSWQADRRRPALLAGAIAVVALGAAGVWWVMRPADEAQQAIERALVWLAAHQDEDGKWDCDEFMKHDEVEPQDGPGSPVHDVGVTGLALIAFAGAGSTVDTGPRREVVRRGSDWLQRQQGDDGLIGTNSANDFIYDHAIATAALIKVSNGDRQSPTGRCAQSGLNYLASHRNPYSVWRYQPRDGNDTSVTVWCVAACVAGTKAGYRVDQESHEFALAWLSKVTDESGRHGYERSGEGSSRKSGDHQTRFPQNKTEAMTAAGLSCRLALGRTLQDDPIMAKAADLLVSLRPTWNERDGSIDFYYWYYATAALRRVGGRWWKRWEPSLRRAVLERQRVDGEARGSWNPVGAWGEDGGRVYATALLCMTLQEGALAREPD